MLGELLKIKTSHDVYRLLSAVEINILADGLAKLLVDPLSEEVTHKGLQYIQELFADGASAPGSESAGRTEENIGSPATVGQSTAALAEELLNEIRKKGIIL